jgi:hypothetical protein
VAVQALLESLELHDLVTFLPMHLVVSVVLMDPVGRAVQAAVLHLEQAAPVARELQPMASMALRILAVGEVEAVPLHLQLLVTAATAGLVSHISCILKQLNSLGFRALNPRAVRAAHPLGECARGGLLFR